MTDLDLPLDPSEFSDETFRVLYRVAVAVRAGEVEVARREPDRALLLVARDPDGDWKGWMGEDGLMVAPPDDGWLYHSEMTYRIVTELDAPRGSP